MADSDQSQLEKLKARLEDQCQQIDALVRGREEYLSTISDLQAELALVARERDDLRKQLSALEGMQTETLALDDEHQLVDGVEVDAMTPTIDELMESISGTDSCNTESHSTRKTEVDTASADEFQEMLSPQEMVMNAKSSHSGRAEPHLPVLIDSGDAKSRHAIDQDLITIGRSESADIKCVDDSISRIHARVLRIGMDMIIEDAGSKNGTWVNSEQVERHVLRHGDAVRVGCQAFRYLDAMGARRELE